MAKAGNGARLTFESLSNFRCVSYPLSENLDGDRAVQAHISRPIHFSHASSAEERFNLVGTEFRSGSESHSCARLYPGASFCEGCNLFRCVVGYSEFMSDHAEGVESCWRVHGIIVTEEISFLHYR